MIIPNTEIRKFINIVPPIHEIEYAKSMQEKKVLTNQIILLPFLYGDLIVPKTTTVIL